MKGTGIVRRIDELGRIVIPKEIRRTHRLHVGAQMEIFTSDAGELILKKFSPVNEIKDFAQIFCQAISELGEFGVVVNDADAVIAVSNVSKKEYLNKPISTELEKLIFERKTYILNTSENTTTYPLYLNDKNAYTSQIIVPILAQSDVVGAIVLLSQKKDVVLSAADVKIVQTVSNILTRILE